MDSWWSFVPYNSARLAHSLLFPFFGSVLQTHKKVAIHGLAGGRLILTEKELLDEVTSKAKYHGGGGRSRQYLCEGRRGRLCQLASNPRITLLLKGWHWQLSLEHWQLCLYCSFGFLQLLADSHPGVQRAPGPCPVPAPGRAKKALKEMVEVCNKSLLGKLSSLSLLPAQAKSPMAFRLLCKVIPAPTPLPRLQ